METDHTENKIGNTVHIDFNAYDDIKFKFIVSQIYKNDEPVQGGIYDYRLGLTESKPE